MRVILIAVLLFSVPGLAYAQIEDPIFKLQQDESLLHISATETREVDQDLLVANLRIEVENADNKLVQNEINTAMAKALELAKGYSEVKAITKAYNVYSYDVNGGRKDMPQRIVWKGQQSVELKSKNAEQLLELAGKMQDLKLIMGGLNYTLSPEIAAQVQDEMLEAALEKLTARAQRAAKALGKTTAELKEINTDGNYIPQPAMFARAEMMAMDSSAKMAAPVASPGETTITMNVNAKALLR